MRPNEPLPSPHRAHPFSDYSDDNGEASSSNSPAPSSTTTAAEDDVTMPHGDYEIQEDKDDQEHDHHYHHHHHQQQQQQQDWDSTDQSIEADPHRGYISDDHDMDDGGAPLVDYLNIANLLTNDVDMDHESGNEGAGDVEEPSSTQQIGAPVLPPPHYAFPPAPPYYSTMLANNYVQAIPYYQPIFDPFHQTPMAVTEPPPGPPPHPATQADFLDDDDNEALDDVQHTLSNPNPTTLGPDNPGVFDFLLHWAIHGRMVQGMSRDRGRVPHIQGINSQMAEHPQRIQYSDLEGEQRDIQGVDWDNLSVTRREARERRLLMYKNYVNVPASDTWLPQLDVIPNSDNFFRFRRLDIKRNIHLCHFQLRYVLASTSRNQVFYPGIGAVHEFNPLSGQGKVAMSSEDNPNFLVSTLAADHGALVAGGFNGEYCLRRLDSDIEGGSAQVHEGTITADVNSGITNHVQIHLSRGSNSPKAAFASNDTGFRILDIETEKFVSEWKFDKPLNCSAMSPDRRLRVMVGDLCEVLITNAESQGRPQILHSLEGHRDYGFACDWADDGWTVATGAQDKSVMIWDARRWTDGNGKASPVATLRAEMAGIRNLKFSPLGSGKRVLVAAEEADFVNVIDAQTFRSKQTFDIFGEIGGVSFANDGQDLHVLCCDRIRGGLIQLERCRLGAEASHDPDDEMMVRRERYGRSSDKFGRGTDFDWPEFSTTPRRILRHSETKRRRRGAGLGPMKPF